jgi:hypothetical protein
VKKRIPKNFIFIPFWLFLKINRKYFNSRARLVASLGIERNIPKIMDLLAVAVEKKENEECSDSLQPKEERWTSQLKSFWNNRFLEELLIFQQGGEKTAGL